MLEHNHQDLSLYKTEHTQSSSKKITLLIVSLLATAVVLYFLFILMNFYIIYSNEIIETYSSSPYSNYLTALTIVFIVRIIALLFISYFFIKKWVNSE